MSTWKAAGNEAATRAERKPAPVDKGTSDTPPRAVRITALELAADPEVGCDPYNSTGQFLAEELQRYEE